MQHTRSRNSTTSCKCLNFTTRALPAPVRLQQRQASFKCCASACLARNLPSVQAETSNFQNNRSIDFAQHRRVCRCPTAQLHRLSPIRVFQGTAPYDVDDYEWSEEEATGITAAVSGNFSQQTGDNERSRHCSTAGKQNKHTQQDEMGSVPESVAGTGVVGVFVAGWMLLIGVMLKLLRPAGVLLRPMSRQMRRFRPGLARRKLKKLTNELPEGWFAKLNFVWEQPLVKSIRITLSVANWSVRLPVLLTVVLTQGSLLASQVSLPVLAPLLLGTGMMMNSIKANASFIIPRLGLLVVLLWILWFVNSVIQTSWVVLKNQGRIDGRTMSGARMMTECTTLLLAGIVVLSMLGINVNALLLPTGVVLAIASKDLLHNLIAGFYLVLVQPFRLGDKVAVTCNLPNSSSTAANSSGSRYQDGRNQSGISSSSTTAGSAVSSHAQGWFEGVCEKVDLRYTVLRDGRRRLMVPNTAFVSREFLVYDDEVPDTNGRGYGSSASSSQVHSSNSQQQSSPQSHVNSSSSSHPRPSSPEPFIREGHMTTELPPLAPPIFPGMWSHQHAPYAQYHHAQQYPAAAYYTHSSPVQDQPLSADTGSQQQDQQENEQHSDSSQEQQQQQPLLSAESAGRGPPGYLPQGFMAPGLHYVGIPMYYGLPGTGAWRAGDDKYHQQQQQASQPTAEPPGVHEPIPGYPYDSMPPQPPACRGQQHHTAGKHHEQQAPSKDSRVSTSSDLSPNQHRKQQINRQMGSDPDACSSNNNRITGSEVGPGNVPQAQLKSSKPGITQQGAHAAAFVSVSGHQSLSHHGLFAGNHSFDQHNPAQLQHSSKLHYTRMAGYPHAAEGAGLVESWMPPTAATESGAVVSLPGLAALPATRVASAAAAAAAVLGSASAAAELPNADDAVSMAANAVEIVAVGGQATQLVQPLLDFWHNLHLD